MNAPNYQSLAPINYSPAIFPETIDDNFDNDSESFDEIVTKGGKKVFKVDIGHFDDLCRKFQDKCDIPIRKLVGSDKEDFKLMVSYVEILYGTNYYENFYQKVIKYFGNLNHVKPGTVGGYFGGCLISTSFDDQPGCSPICAGAVPRPKDEEGWSFCDQGVVFADKNTNGYNFTLLKEPERGREGDPCYLFVEHTDLHDFKGFSRKEKEKLKELGIHDVYLIGYDEDGTEYVKLYEDVCNIYDIKHRVKQPQTSDKSNFDLAMILIVIFLLLVALFFGWRFWDKNYDLDKNIV